MVYHIYHLDRIRVWFVMNATNPSDLKQNKFYKWSVTTAHRPTTEIHVIERRERRPDKGSSISAGAYKAIIYQN